MAGGCSAPGSLVEELRQDSPMDTNRELGKTILINGASSSGKSTIAQPFTADDTNPILALFV